MLVPHHMYGILDLHALYHPMALGMEGLMSRRLQALGMEGSGEHMLDVQAPADTQPQSRGELGPLFIENVAGMPKCATQLAMKASVHVLAPCCADHAW
jgi:hypothetical protein